MLQLRFTAFEGSTFVAKVGGNCGTPVFDFSRQQSALSEDSDQTIVDPQVNQESQILKESKSSSILKMFPIPVLDNLSIDIDFEIEEITVANVLGETVSSFNNPSKSGSNLYQINLSNLSNGVYFINIFGKTGENLKRKITKI